MSVPHIHLNILNIKLVQEIEKHRCLYDINCEEYSRKDCLEQAWRKVALAVNDTESSCRERWKNIRTSYSRYLRECGQNGVCGIKNRRIYYLADNLRFLLPYMRSSFKTSENLVLNSPSSTNSSGNDLTNITPNYNNDLTNDSTTISNQKYYYYDEEQSATATLTNNAQDEANQQNTNENYKNKRKKNRKDRNFETEVMKYLIQEKRKEEQLDSSAQFLLGLHYDVKALDFKRQRTFKMKVTALLNELHDEQENEKNENSYAKNYRISEFTKRTRTRPSSTEIHQLQDEQENETNDIVKTQEEGINRAECVKLFEATVAARKRPFSAKVSRRT